MCQLTLTDFKNRNLNSLWLYYSLLYNTKEQHKDGCGMFTNRKDIWKTEICPQKITNLEEIISGMNVSDELVLSHVRQISVGKVAKKEDSHPFEKENIILFHNGTLKWKKQENATKYAGIDSEQFASALDEELKTGKPFVECLKKTYSDFTGKFAFLIYHKTSNKVYVVRGYSARLHKAVFYKMVDGKKIHFGTVINTELPSLTDTCAEFVNVLKLLLDIDVLYEIKEIVSEKIYEYSNDSLIELSHIHENYEPLPPVNYPHGKFDEAVDTNKKIIKEIDLALERNMLSVYDLDIICYAMLDKGLAYCSLDEVHHLAANLINTTLTSWNSKEKQKVWFKLKSYIITQQDYADNDLIYPYMLNSIKKLSTALDSFNLKEVE